MRLKANWFLTNEKPKKGPLKGAEELLVGG
jgi:hypothetical protein